MSRGDFLVDGGVLRDVLMGGVSRRQTANPSSVPSAPQLEGRGASADDLTLGSNSGSSTLHSPSSWPRGYMDPANPRSDAHLPTIDGPSSPTSIPEVSK
jgi:hypothetical protein